MPRSWTRRCRRCGRCSEFLGAWHPGWASFLGRPAAIGCKAVGVGGVGLGVLGVLLVLELVGLWGRQLVSSTSTALRAEYEYEDEQGGGRLDGVSPHRSTESRPTPRKRRCAGGSFRLESGEFYLLYPP